MAFEKKSRKTIIILTETILPDKTCNYSMASFQFKILNDAPIRYFLVLLPAYNESGAHLPDHPQWKEMAESTGGALVGCTFKTRPKEDQSIHYAAARYGSGQALEKAVKRLSERLNQPTLQSLPFLMYGHSAGGQFAYGFSCHNPSRMIAFVSVKGGIFFPEPFPETYQVPGLLISGEKDLERRKTAIRSLFEAHRKNNAPWCWMEEKLIGHKEGDCLSVAIPYLKSVLSHRLEGSYNQLKILDLKKGLWVDLAKQMLADEKYDFEEIKNDSQYGWLPGEEVFGKWKILDNGLDKYTPQE